MLRQEKPGITQDTFQRCNLIFGATFVCNMPLQLPLHSSVLPLCSDGSAARHHLQRRRQSSLSSIRMLPSSNQSVLDGGQVGSPWPASPLSVPAVRPGGRVNFPPASWVCLR